MIMGPQTWNDENLENLTALPLLKLKYSTGDPWITRLDGTVKSSEIALRKRKNMS
jgi:hypothetical protein